MGSIGTNIPYHGAHFALKADDSGDRDRRVGNRANRWEGRNGGLVRSRIIGELVGIMPPMGGPDRPNGGH